MKIIKTIGNCCLIFLTVIAMMVTIAFGYYHFFVKDETVGVNNISDQLGIDLIEKKEDLTEEEIDIYEERWFMEANYYSNHNNNGIQLQELNFNYFTNYHLTSNDYRSTGMQFLGDYKHHNVTVKSESERDNYVFKDFYYYATPFFSMGSMASASAPDKSLSPGTPFSLPFWSFCSSLGTVAAS